MDRKKERVNVSMRERARRAGESYENTRALRIYIATPGQIVGAIIAATMLRFSL